jgi:hypothetical protein
MACCTAMVFAFSVSSQQRVQSTTQLTLRTPIVAEPLAEWEKEYAQAMKVAQELAEEGSIEDARRLADDLEDLDKVLRDYIRASERLRHKDRALSQTMEFLALQNVVQMESRRYQTIANALKAAHDVEQSTVRNMRN